MERRSLTGIAVLVIGLAALAPAITMAQETAPPGMALSTRLPATVDGSPVEVVGSEDLQTLVDAWYPGETPPEVEALTARLSEQGLSLADVATVTAYFGPDQGGAIMGFGIPGGDAASLQDAITAVYSIGLGELERTEREVGDHTVTFLSEGPLDAADYPFAVMPDADVLWVLSADMEGMLDALEALLAVAAGTAPGNTTTAPPTAADIGPATWFGTIRQTIAWNQGVYVGEATATFRGTLEKSEREDYGYCESPCAAYLPMGEVEWTWETAGPNCSNVQAGSVPTGDVVTPSDQILIMAPAGTDHLRYWGSGLVDLPPQDCEGREGTSNAGNFLDIPRPDEEDPFRDLSTVTRPLCANFDWRIAKDAKELKGTCWRYDERGYEERFDWDLRDVDPE